jgi:hypothetical protein
MFLMGETYKTRDGSDVRIITRIYPNTDDDTVRGDDGLWRHNCAGAMGRLVASQFTDGHPKDLLPVGE